MTVPKLYGWTKSLSLRAFLIAFVLTLVGLSVLGRWYSQQNPYPHFVRFHQLISPETLYYPTISHLRAIAKEQLQDRDKIGVIVGGSSVLHGMSQPPDKIWTKDLQQRLGDRYRVINFAMAAGHVQGGGAIAAQSLLEEGYKIIYVSDIGLGMFFIFDGGEQYRYLLWDALYKGLLKEYPPLFREINTTFNSSQLNELKLRMWLDSLFYFNDLWTTVGYKHFFTVWNSLIARRSPLESFTKPRIQTLDTQIGYEPKPFPERFKAWEEIVKDLTKIEHNAITTLCKNVYEWNDDQWVLKQTAFDTLNHQAQITFPESFRRHILLVIGSRNPYYFESLDPRYAACWRQGNGMMARQVRQAGYWAIELGSEFTGEDFNDNTHLLPSGGVKLAKVVAPKIEEMAVKQGYLK
ncbi:MAG: hypothetical protein NW224_02325 [Leptolyngbyaceae cyanobacterium bins.302]|nr:hypothetical protein [Leptolyngbyaceae cyanobacterium bins.302]